MPGDGVCEADDAICTAIGGLCTPGDGVCEADYAICTAIGGLYALGDGVCVADDVKYIRLSIGRNSVCFIFHRDWRTALYINMHIQSVTHHRLV